MLRSVPPGPRSRAPHSASTSGNFNPNCHFYLQAPGASIPPAHRIRSTSLSEASFNPWSPSDSNPPIPATTHASLWAYPASSMWSNNNIQKQRTRSICFEKTCRYLRSMETNDMVEDALFREEGKVTFLWCTYVYMHVRTYVLASYHRMSTCTVHYALYTISRCKIHTPLIV